MAVPDPLAEGRGVDQAERSMRAKRSWAIVAAIVAAGALVRLSGACVLADPPASLPVVAEHAPIIDTASAVPLTSAGGQPFLTTWPSQFVIPVEVLDPTQTLYYQAFYDYTPLTMTPQLLDFLGGGDAGSPSGGDLVLARIVLKQPLSSTVGCHVVEIVMGFGPRFSTPHTPPAGTGSTISWLYIPSGNPSSCIPDAGFFLDGSLPAAPDAADAKGDAPDSGL